MKFLSKTLSTALLAALILPQPSIAADAISMQVFAKEYAEWKADFNMSKFLPSEDRAITDAVRTGNCEFIRTDLYKIAVRHLPTDIKKVRGDHESFARSIAHFHRGCVNVNQKVPTT